MFSCSFLLVLWLTGFEGFGGVEKGHCDVNDHEYEEILLRGDDQGCNYMKKYDSTLTFCIINIYKFTSLREGLGTFAGMLLKHVITPAGVLEFVGLMLKHVIIPAAVLQIKSKPKVGGLLVNSYHNQRHKRSSKTAFSGL